MRVFVAQINSMVGDFKGNTDKILNAISRAKNCDLILFPEMCITGYPPEDFLLLSEFIDSAEKALNQIIEASKEITVIVGLPRRHGEEKKLANSAAIIHNQKLLGFQDKALLPTYDVFDESRYFDSAKEMKVWDIQGKKIGVTICEDIWQHSELIKFTSYKYDPILEFKDIDLLLNLSASPFSRDKFSGRISACSKAATTLNVPVILCNQVGGNDSLIFDGYSFFVNQNGKLCAVAKGFEEDDFEIDLSTSLTSIDVEQNLYENIYKALCLGVRDYFSKSGFSEALIGLSGGIDSALVACIAKDVLGAENVFALSMPSRYTAETSIRDARQLASNLNIDLKEVSIEQPFDAFLQLLAPSFADCTPDITEENLQARIRGMLLMAFSNKFGKIVLSTGNKSEVAMGYATLYGDMVGGLGVLSDVTKQEVYALARWVNRNHPVIPQNILDKAPSAELRPNQKDSDSLPDYEIIDHVLRDYVEEHLAPSEIAKKHQYPLDVVQDLVRRIHQNEYKRRQSAPGLRISERAFTAGYRFPIVAKL